jgi:hypothetical protein
MLALVYRARSGKRLCQQAGDGNVIREDRSERTVEPEAYPLFMPPPHLAEKGAKAWTKGEADEYSAWLQANLERRVGEMLTFLAVSGDGPPREVLDSAGRSVADLIRQEPFSDGLQLTDRGRALAADIGLLAAMLLRRSASSIRWEVLRRPKTDMSFNMPVLVGFTNGLSLDPVGGSIAEAVGLLRGTKGPAAWARIYEWWIDKT